jgi:hypothetical protein
VATPTAAITPEPEGFVEFGDTHLIKWRSSLGVQWQVIQEMTNSGDGWANVNVPGEYTIYDKDGNVVTTGVTSIGFPQFVGPGEKAYLVDSNVSDSISLDDLVSVEVNGGWEGADEPAFSFPVTKTKYTSHKNADRLTGVVENDSSEDLPSCEVVAIVLDAHGKPLGYGWVLMDGVVAGGMKPFVIDFDRPFEGMESVSVYGHG